MEVIDKWVTEFFIRCQHNPRGSPTKLRSALKFGDSPDCLKLKISSVLRGHLQSLIRGTVEERTLDLLEILEKLLMQQRSRKSNISYTAVSFLTQLVKEQWALLGSSTLESVAQGRVLKRKAENNVECDSPNDVDEITERLESDTADDANEQRGSGMGTVGMLKEWDVWRMMGLISCGLIVKQQDNASEKGSGSQRTCSGRVRPRLPSPVPLNISPLKSADSFVRRRKKFWTPEEVEALREGVKEYGKSWKDIKNANPAVFAKRTEVSMSLFVHSYSSVV
uniref:HTH myb-type domain-containing protein n=1 Tax=Brassica campestris TaxID=3711 RepID=M4DV30_BRACM